MSQSHERLSAALADRYRLERELGRGGMATVYLAQDLKHDRQVAIKVLKPELAAALGAERFLREVRITARLNHPHILPLLDSGEANGFLYYVMPYVEGESLRDRLFREKQLSLDDALQITREVADALSYAHGQDVVHRDIKPENILLHSGHAVVADFGIARAISTAGGEGLTETGIAMGTPAYMSPEQATATQEVDGRADEYALGCVLFEMLAGEPPYTGPTPQAVLARALTETPRPIHPVRVAVSPGLDRVIARATAATPADRYRTAAEFAKALMSTTHGPKPRRLRHWAWAALAAALLAGGYVGFRLLQARRGATPTTVVVLPFTNVGADPHNQAFVDGIMEVLTSKLTQLEPFFSRPMWVIPASEVRHKQIESAAAARRDFAATLAVSGSVQRYRDTIHLTLNLVDTKTLRQLRSDFLEGPVEGLDLWQAGIVDHLANMLDAGVRPEAARVVEKGRTTKADAYDVYVQGWGYLETAKSVAELQRAVEAFRAAVDRDPRFALGHAALAEAFWDLYERTSDTSWVDLAVAASPGPRRGPAYQGQDLCHLAGGPRHPAQHPSGGPGAVCAAGDSNPVAGDSGVVAASTGTHALFAGGSGYGDV